MISRIERRHIRGVGGNGLCGQPAGAFAYGDPGKAMFASTMGDPVCEMCLRECDWPGTAAIAAARR